MQSHFFFSFLTQRLVLSLAAAAATSAASAASPSMAPTSSVYTNPSSYAVQYNQPLPSMLYSTVHIYQPLPPMLYVQYILASSS